MAKNPIVTIVIAVTSDRRVRRLIDSLLSQSVPTGTFEIIVVENGSSELADIESMGDGETRYFNIATANMAKARNVGLAAANGRYLLLTDADCVAQPDWIERMIERLDEGQYSAVGGRIHKFEPTTWAQKYAITVVDGQNELSYLPALQLPYVAGANAGFLTAEVRKLGGFDEQLRSGNDVDICYRLTLAGKHVGLAPRAVVLHEDRASLSAHFSRFRNYAIFQVLLFAKYRHVSRLRFVINPYPPKRVGAALLATPRALFDLLRGNVGPISRTLLQLVEAAGVWCGDIEGSIRHRQLYL